MNLPTMQESRDWAVFTLVIAARVYRTMLLTLVTVAVLPALFSWSPYVIESGSMEPSIAVGDVAVGKPFNRGDEVAVGRAYMYEDPANGTDRTMVHRIVERRDDGDYTTAGDANDVTDIEPLGADGIEARAILLVPYVGKPVVWWHTGAWGPLGLWLLLTLGAFVVALRFVDGEPPRWTMLGLLRRAARRPRPTRRREDADRPGTPVAARVAATAAAALVLGMVGTGVGTANATFTARTVSSGSSWQAGQWLLPYVEAVLADSPTGFWLLDETSGPVTDRSGTYPAGRSVGSVQRGVGGALTERNPGTAYSFDGGRAILHDQAIGAPGAYSVELWFKTAANRAGYLIGFESGTGDTSSRYDRTLLIDDRGRLEVGAWGASSRTVRTPKGYSDGIWHHLVVTAEPSGSSQAAVIFVDGQQITQGRSSEVGGFVGHWRIGGGTVPDSSGVPQTFRGDLDAVAVYPRALTAEQVRAHYDAR